MSRILIIEDDVRLASTMQKGLQEQGYDVDVAHTGARAMQILERSEALLITLDLGLPDCDGMDLLKEIRARRTADALLVLTARDALPDKVKGLDRGADDYLVKPFAFAELLARLRSLSRRTQAPHAHTFTYGEVTIDMVSRRVLKGQQEIDITPREYDLLIYLAQHGGQIVSREMLARDVWHETSRATPLDNVIDVHMHHLRKKLSNASGDSPLKVIRGIGVRLGAAP